MSNVDYELGRAFGIALAEVSPEATQAERDYAVRFAADIVKPSDWGVFFVGWVAGFHTTRLLGKEMSA
jgi:hypothetical protein